MPNAPLQHRKSPSGSRLKRVARQVASELKHTSTALIHPVVQAKLRMSAPNDPYEQEADRVADHVMRVADSEIVGAAASQAPMENAAPSIQRMCTACAEEEEKLQRKPIQDAITPTIPFDGEARIRSLRASGRPMSEYERTFFEPRFGHDFGKVRVHSDARAAATAQAAQARAFTMGSDIVFAAGQYKPATGEGRRLMAHELAHVVQQSGRSSLCIQRAEAGGCADSNDAGVVKSVGDAVTRLVQNHAAAQSGVGSELMIPRAATDLETQSCLPNIFGGLDGAGHGRADLYKIDGLRCQVAEIKPSGSGPDVYKTARGQSSHYILRIKESISRLRNTEPCLNDQKGQDDMEFDKRYFGGQLAGSEDKVTVEPLSTEVIGDRDIEAGKYNQKTLYYRNFGGGVVLYECRTNAPSDEGENPPVEEPRIAPSPGDCPPIEEGKTSGKLASGMCYYTIPDQVSEVICIEKGGAIPDAERRRCSIIASKLRNSD